MSKQEAIEILRNGIERADYPESEVMKEALAALEQAEPPSCTKSPLEYPLQIHLAEKTQEEFYVKLRALIPEDLFERTKQAEPEPGEPCLNWHIGWYCPGNQRFCYTDTKAAFPERHKEYTMKVYTGDLIDRLTRENKHLNDALTKMGTARLIKEGVRRGLLPEQE